MTTRPSQRPTTPLQATFITLSAGLPVGLWLGLLGFALPALALLLVGWVALIALFVDGADA